MSRYLLGFVLLYFLYKPSMASELKIAVASNFSSAAKEIGSSYTQKNKIDIVFSFGSSGKIYSQIRNGAPYDIFLSADQVRPEKLIQEGKALAQTRMTYATGQLVLWSPQENLIKSIIDGEGKISDAQKIKAIKHLAIANHKLAPYGLAAVQVMEKMKLQDIFKGKIVLGENISQAYQFVASGNAEVGFVALSQVISQYGENNYWRIPLDYYNPIKQDGVILSRSQKLQESKDFLQFLTSEEAKKIIIKHGYR